MASRSLIFRREQSQVLGELFKALAAAKLEPEWVSAVAKNARAQYGGFVNMAGLIGATEVALSRHSLVVNQTFHWDTELLLVTEIGHGGSGEFIRSILPIPKGGKIQETKSAITYMRRAGYEALLGLAPADPAADDDGDAAEESRVGNAPLPEKDQWRRVELMAQQKIAAAKTPQEILQLLERVHHKVAAGEMDPASIARLELTAANRRQRLEGPVTHE
jgi:hypothetical protein